MKLKFNVNGCCCKNCIEIERKTGDVIIEIKLNSQTIKIKHFDKTVVVG